MFSYWRQSLGISIALLIGATLSGCGGESYYQNGISQSQSSESGDLVGGNGSTEDSGNSDGTTQGNNESGNSTGSGGNGGGETPPTPPAPAQCNLNNALSQNFTQNVETDRKIDILFVVDTSGSMDAELKKIGEQASKLVKALLTKNQNIDYRVAVLLAHGTGSYSGKLFGGLNNCGPVVAGGLGNDFDVAGGAGENLLCKLNNVASESGGATGEAGLQSLKKLTSGDNLSLAKQQGFFRGDAALAVIFASDENDICSVFPGFVKESNSNQTYEDTYRKNSCTGITPQAVYDQLGALLMDRPLSVSAMVITDPQDYHYGYGYIGNNKDYGKGIVELAQGISVPISDNADTVAANLSKIGENTANKITKTTKFKLDVTTQIEILKVNVFGADIDAAKYQYDQSSMLLSIEPDYAGEDKQVITVYYCPK